VSNALPTNGGADAETVADALARVPGELRRHDRAVTASDFQELAFATPGVTLGRAECLPLFYPKAPDLIAAGVVSVVVWPREDPKHPSAPMPDRPTLDRVCRWLDARRLVTTELYVIPPTYRQIAVAVGIETKQGYGVDAVRGWVELVIRQYLAPLPPFGPTGEGWPLGGPVYGRELEAAALQVEGVRFLVGLTLAWRTPGGSWTTVDRDKPVELARYEVPELAEISVAEAAVPVIGQTPVPPELIPVPVPVPREEC
jgi:predicted phage baseplate assembly protein